MAADSVTDGGEDNAPGGAPDQRLVIFLYTDDFEGLTAFYGTVLGLVRVLEQRTEKGAVDLYRLHRDGYIGVSNFQPRPRGVDGFMLTLVLDDPAAVDAEHARLTAAGVAFEGPPGWGVGDTVYGAFFRDPEGRRMEIQAFRDPRWDAAVAGIA
ncbi:MAG: VOC family protein [Pseudomonadota bacterium]